MNFQKTSFSFDSKCDFFSVLDFTPRTSSSSWPNGRGHSSPVESVSKKKCWCYLTYRLVLLSYIPSVCHIWKGLTLFYYYGETNHILALSMAAFCIILAYILIFEKILDSVTGDFSRIEKLNVFFFQNSLEIINVGTKPL